MNRTLLFSTLLVLGTGLSQAAVIPSCNSLQTFADLINAGSCTAGIFTIKNPTFSGGFEGLESSLFLATSADSQNVSFGFTGLELYTSFDESLSFTFGYTIDPPPDIIKGVSGSIDDAGQSSFEEFLNVAAVGDAVDIGYQLCAGAAFVQGQCAGTPYGFSLTVPDQNSANLIRLASQLSGGVTFASPVNTVGVIVNVNLNNGGFVQGGFSSVFPLDPVGDVPEPGTMALAGIGGALLAASRLRRRSR